MLLHAKFIRLLSLSLVLLLLLSLTVFVFSTDIEEATQTEETQQTMETEQEPLPEQEEDPTQTEATEQTTESEQEPLPEQEDVPTDEELIEQYHIPDTWAREALLFAVRNNILYGSGDGTLNPERKATRAEIATILAGALPTKHSADLTDFADLDPALWYYQPMSHAAALRLISGTGENRMSPNAHATREQVAVIIAKAFGLTTTDESVLYSFNDGVNVSSWATPAMAAMVEAGYLAGYNNYLNPQANISRQEFAQILYSIVDRFAAQTLTQTEGTTVTYLSEIPAGTVIEGNLLICSDTTELNLNQVTVTGKLIVQGVDLLSLKTTDCKIHELVVCRPTDMDLDGSVDGVIALADVVIHGQANSVTMAGGDVIVASNAELMLLLADERAKGGTLVVDGILHTAKIDTVISVKGDGAIKQADVWAPSFMPELAPETVNFTEDHGISELVVHAEPSDMPSVEKPKIAVTLSFGGTLPKEPCDLIWCVNGVYLCEDNDVTVTENLKVARSIDFSGNFHQYANRLLNIVVKYRGRCEVYTFKIPIRQSYLMYELSDVRTLDIPATVNFTTNTYSDKELTKKIGSVEKGTTVIYRAYRGTQAAQILLPNGSLVWVRYDAITISQEGHYTGKDYTEEVKEAWINQKGYSSKTNYLIWCNLYTQRINIFYGSKGNWKLVHVSQCATGSNYTPTPLEVTQIYYKTQKWYYEEFYVHHVSVFDSSRGFHSMLYNYDSYTLYNTAMGCPASHGCVRVPDEGIMYIWNKVPINSTVVIY